MIRARPIVCFFSPDWMKMNAGRCLWAASKAGRRQQLFFFFYDFNFFFQIQFDRLSPSTKPRISPPPSSHTKQPQNNPMRRVGPPLLGRCVATCRRLALKPVSAQRQSRTPTNKQKVRFVFVCFSPQWIYLSRLQ